LRSGIPAALWGSDLIIHAGDAGSPEVIEALRKLAPTFAVRGNVDTAPWAASLPMTEAVTVGELSFFVIHDIAQLDPAAAGFAAAHTEMNCYRAASRSPESTPHRRGVGVKKSG